MTSVIFSLPNGVAVIVKKPGLCLYCKHLRCCFVSVDDQRTRCWECASEGSPMKKEVAMDPTLADYAKDSSLTEALRQERRP